MTMRCQSRGSDASDVRAAATWRTVTLGRCFAFAFGGLWLGTFGGFGGVTRTTGGLATGGGV
jgi:hypothetical protein